MKTWFERWAGAFLVFSFVWPAAGDTARLVKQLATRKAERAASQLADMGKDALDALKEALAHRKWQIRYWAAYALAYNKAAKEGGAVDALKPVLADGKRRVGLRAAMALIRLGERSVLPFARGEAKSPKAHRRAEAVAALAVSGDASVVPALVEAVGDSHGKVRYWALIGLAELGGKDALAHGLKHARDRNPEVQTGAIEVLGAHGKESGEVEDLLVELLKGRSPLVRERAAAVLSRIGTKRSLGALRKARDKDRSAAVRSMADAAVVEIMKRIKKG